MELEIRAGKSKRKLVVLYMMETHGNVAIYTAYAGDEIVGQVIDADCGCKKCRGS